MITWSYIAGFIDCDGWITKSHGKYTVGMTQSSLFFKEMKEISDFLNDRGVTNSLIERRAMSMIRGVSHSSKMINIHIKKHSSLKILCENILQFSLIKQQKVHDCLLYAIDRLEKRGYDVAVSNQSTNQYWKEAEIQKLVHLHSKGYGNRAIALKLQRSIDSVSHKLYRLKLKRNHPL